jgi:hypothetical protein
MLETVSIYTSVQKNNSVGYFSICGGHGSGSIGLFLNGSGCE